MTGRGMWEVDEDRALEALRYLWGDAYDGISVGHGARFPVWAAVSNDAEQRMITARGPDAFNRALRADWVRRCTP